MTCQHCQTWVLDGEHRCHRCGRRVRTMPARISPNSYPIAATATAPEYGFAAETKTQSYAEPGLLPVPDASPTQGQRPLFALPLVDPRVIPFDSLTTPIERESIRARAADLARPAPLESATVEIHRPRSRKNNPSNQHHFDFSGEQKAAAPPQSSIICDAPVASITARLEAAGIDLSLITVGCSFGFALFKYAGGQFTFDKHSLPFFLLALSTVVVAYELIWVVIGCDSPGMRRAGLRLVDFDGNPPSQPRRYGRLLGSILSLLAAGVGIIWSLLDEDRLTWHDYISNTFPTFAAEE